MEQNHPLQRRRGRRAHIPRSLIRRIAGWSLIALGILGCVLPVLPGLVLIALGILVIGPHDPLLRRLATLVRIALRRWSRVKQPHLRRLGRWVRWQYRTSRLMLREHLHRHEHGTDGWRAHLPLLGVTLAGVAMSAAVMLLLWHTIL
jgi:hypothetical protein